MTAKNPKDLFLITREELETLASLADHESLSSDAQNILDDKPVHGYEFEIVIERREGVLVAIVPEHWKGKITFYEHDVHTTEVMNVVIDDKFIARSLERLQS